MKKGRNKILIQKSYSRILGTPSVSWTLHTDLETISSTR